MSQPKFSNPDLEASVLGGIFFHPEILPTLPLEVDDFLAATHQAVFIAMRNLEYREQAIDHTLVAAELARMGKLGDAAERLTLLAELTVKVSTPDNVERYAHELRELRARREMLGALREAVCAVETSDDDRAELVLERVLRRLSLIRIGCDDPTVSLGSLMHNELGAIESDLAARERGEHVGGMPTGLDKLDALTGGLPRGVVTLVLGETGHGKSTLAMSFARAAADLAGDTPLLFSYEDGGRSFAQRAIAQDSGVHTQVIRRRSFRGDELNRVVRDGMRNAGMRRERIAKVRGADVTELKGHVRRFRAKGPQYGAATVGNLVIVDYLQAMPKPRAPHIRSTPEALGEICQQLEDLAATEDIAVVLFSQINDEPTNRDDHRPKLRDGAGGRDAAKGAKLVLGIYRPWMYDSKADPYAGEILILKNNDGETHRSATVFLDLATHRICDTAPPKLTLVQGELDV